MLISMVVQSSANHSSTPQALADETARWLRERIADGFLVPGAALREVDLAEQRGVSRNTLREAFRILSHEGLITQIPYKGAFVTMPTISGIIDLYRVRRMIECQALEMAFVKHPAVGRMRSAVEAGDLAKKKGDWQGVGTADIAFHDAIIGLADSPRLSAMFRQFGAEMRLAFGVVDDPEYLHGPFLDRNRGILELVEAGDFKAASRELDEYLVRAERLVVAAYERAEVAARG